MRLYFKYIIKNETNRNRFYAMQENGEYVEFDYDEFSIQKLGGDSLKTIPANTKFYEKSLSTADDDFSWESFKINPSKAGQL